MPRRSMAITRAKVPMRRCVSAISGILQFSSRFVKNPGMSSTSIGPEPNTWNAMNAPSGARVYRVSGTSIYATAR
jgi:hypothetical protein